MNTLDIIDISPVIDETLAVWPGDIPFSKNFTLKIDNGHNIDLGSITSTLHLGSHADARSHYIQKGETIDEMPLQSYIGLCQVIDVSGSRGRITTKDIKQEIIAPRVLFRTLTQPDASTFNRDFSSLSEELIRFLHHKKVVLVGIDTPSIDPFDDKELESHQAIDKYQVCNLEGLNLTGAPEGLYLLVALPLRIRGADASPVRAILLPKDWNR